MFLPRLRVNMTGLAPGAFLSTLQFFSGAWILVVEASLAFGLVLGFLL